MWRSLSQLATLAVLVALSVAILASASAEAGPSATSGSAGGRPGTVDPTFGKAGQVVARPPREPASSEFEAAIREPDGDFAFLLRRSTSASASPDELTEVEMHSPSGAPVASFGDEGRTAVEGGTTLATTADGDILVAVDDCEGERSSVELLDQSGVPIPSFGNRGCGAAIDFGPEWMSVDAQGRITLAGKTYYCEPCAKDIAPTMETAFARILPDGSLDPTFGEAGIVHTHKLSGDEIARLQAETGYPPAPPDGRAAVGQLHLPHQADIEAVATAPGGDTFVLIAEQPGPGCRPCIPTPLLTRLTPSGRLDRNYGRNGVVELATPREGSSPTVLHPRSLLVAGDGSALIAGRVGEGEGRGDAIAIAVAPNGAPDRSFDDDGRLLEQFTEPARLEATGLTVGSRGELITVSRHADTPGRWSGFAITFGADGGQRPRPRGAVETRSLGVIEPDGPGRIVGWGGEREDRVLLASWKDGRRVKSYGHNGSARMPEKFVPQAIAPAPGGGVAVFGSMQFHGIAVYRVGPSGHPLHGFGDEGLAILSRTASESSAYAGLVEADGDVVLTGYRGGIVAARLLPDGDPDPNFGRGGFVRDLDHDGYGAQIAPLDGGLVIASGARGTPAEVGPRLIALDSRGRPLRSFGRAGRVRGGAENGPLALFTDGGRIVTVTDPEFEPDHKGRSGIELWAYRPDGKVDRSFGDDGTLLYGSGGAEGHQLVPAEAVQQRDGRIVVAGTHGSGGDAKLVLARFR